MGKKTVKKPARMHTATDCSLVELALARPGRRSSRALHRTLAGCCVIRPLAPGDHAEWLRMRKALWPERNDDWHAWGMRLLVEQSGSSRVFVYPRRHEIGKLGGFVELLVTDGLEGSLSRPVGRILAWYVDPDLQGIGIGRRLLETAEHWAAERGLREIVSECPLEDSRAQVVCRAAGLQEAERLIRFRKAIRGRPRTRLLSSL